MGPVDLAQRFTAVRADQSKRQIRSRKYQGTGAAIWDHRCRGARVRDAVRAENLLADVAVLSESAVCPFVPVGVRADLGLSFVSPPVRSVGHHHRRFAQGFGPVSGRAGDLRLWILDAHRGTEPIVSQS